MSGNDRALGGHEKIVTDLRSRYVKALVAEDRSSAIAVVEEGLARGLTLPSLLLDLLSRAQTELGESWRRGELSISQEHWATRVTEEQMERVLERLPTVISNGFSAVVSTVPDETHTIPVRVLAGLLRWRGWSVDYLGSGPPAADLVEFVRQRQPQLVALSVTVATHGPSCLDVCRQLRRLDSVPAILVGGGGVVGWRTEDLQADAIANDLLQGLDVAARLIGFGPDRDLGPYLAVVGRRIQKHRRELGLSQAGLARRSKLTRPYLSAVEGGRQNVTLEVALKIAGGLGISMARLLEEEPDTPLEKHG